MASLESEAAFDRAKFERFKSKDYRMSYMSARVRTSIAWQIRELRESNQMSQSELAKRIGTRQSAVSRLENTEYGRASVQTLLDVATALDVALVVKFASYDEFLRQHGSLKESALSVENFTSTYEHYTNREDKSIGDAQRSIPSQLWQRLFENIDANTTPTLALTKPKSQSAENMNIRFYRRRSAQHDGYNSSFLTNVDKAFLLYASAPEERSLTTRQERAA